MLNIGVQTHVPLVAQTTEDQARLARRNLQFVKRHRYRIVVDLLRLNYGRP